MFKMNRNHNPFHRILFDTNKWLPTQAVWRRIKVTFRFIASAAFPKGVSQRLKPRNSRPGPGSNLLRDLGDSASFEPPNTRLA